MIQEPVRGVDQGEGGVRYPGLFLDFKCLVSR